MFAGDEGRRFKGYKHNCPLRHHQDGGGGLRRVVVDRPSQPRVTAQETKGSGGAEMLAGVRGRLVTHLALVSFTEEATVASAEPPREERSHTDRHTPDPAAVGKQWLLWELNRLQSPFGTGIARIGICHVKGCTGVRHRSLGKNLNNPQCRHDTAAQRESKECQIQQ